MKTGAGIGALLAATVLLLSCGPIQPTAGNQPSCEDVRYQCAFDSACSEGLKSYFLMCDKLLQADTTKCPETCLFALVALTTTYHGQRLLDVSVVLFSYCIRLLNDGTRPGIVFRPVYRNDAENVPGEGGEWLPRPRFFRLTTTPAMSMKKYINQFSYINRITTTIHLLL